MADGSKMNPEERFARLEAIVTRLGERTDAIAQSVELLAGMQIDSEKRLTQTTNQLTQTTQQLTQTTVRLQETMATFADGIALLTRVTIDHTDRITRLEDRNRPQH